MQKYLPKCKRQATVTGEEAPEYGEAANEGSSRVVPWDVDDLDVIQTPESLLLAAVMVEDVQDRSDWPFLTPWVKYLWESCRQCLVQLRNKKRVDKLYHDVVKQTFKFCMKYGRQTKFWKLCDNLRNHLKPITEKTSNQQTALSLSNPDQFELPPRDVSPSTRLLYQHGAVAGAFQSCCGYSSPDSPI